MVKYKLGRLPNDPTKPRLRLSAHLAKAPAPPQAVKWFSPYMFWGMQGNDEWGDCTCAANAHIVEQQTGLGDKKEIRVSTSQTLAMYSKLFGFDPNAGPPGENPTDQGGTVQGALEGLRKDGLAGWKIAAFAELDASNLTEVKQAIAEFGCVDIGVNLPESAQEQFAENEPWTVVKGSPIEGGHDIVLMGYDKNYFYASTWGAFVAISYEWLREYMEEAWAPIAKDWVSETGGLSLEAFGEEFTALTGEPNPFQ